jgi:methylated-DNA-[protein]-cysteine S-methyltransferase
MSNANRFLEDFRAAFADERAERRSRARLVALAESEGILDVAYRTVESPLGPLLLAATPAGLLRVAFDREDYAAVLERLAREVSPRVLAAPRRLDAAARQLDEYFARKRKRFDLPIDLRLARGFRRTVIARLPEIPYGSTASYAALAGNAAAVRTAAGACSHNPLPVVVPCRRVVRSDGGIGEYLGGSEAKRALLAIEAAA